jgi:hypothetical protein
MAYSDVKSAFLARMNRRDLANDTTGLADLFLQDAIKRVQRNLEIPAGEKSISVVIGNSTYFNNNFIQTYPNGISVTGGLLIPTDFIRMRDITYYNGNGEPSILRKAPLTDTAGAIFFGVPGCVIMYSRQGSMWILGPLPIAGNIVRIDYYSEYATVINPTDDNVLLDIADDLIVYGALSYAADHYNDKRGPQFEQRFTQILSDLQAQADADETSGDAAVGQAYYYPPDHI